MHNTTLTLKDTCSGCAIPGHMLKPTGISKSAARRLREVHAVDFAGFLRRGGDGVSLSGVQGGGGV